MTMLHEPVASLPEVALSEIPEGTKDFLLAQSGSAGKSVTEVIRAVLNEAAADAGFPAEAQEAGGAA